MILKTVFPYSHFQWLKLHSFPNRSGVHLSKRVSQVQISFLNPHLLVGQLYQVRRPFDVLCVMFRMIIQFHQYKCGDGTNAQKQGVVMNLYNRAQSLITKSTDWKKDFYLICSLKMTILYCSYKKH